MAVETGGNNCHADLIIQTLVNNRTEYNVRIRFRGFGDNGRRLVYFKETEVPTSGDIEQDALCALD